MCPYAQDANGVNTGEEVWSQEIYNCCMAQLPPSQQRCGQALNCRPDPWLGEQRCSLALVSPNHSIGGAVADAWIRLEERPRDVVWVAERCAAIARFWISPEVFSVSPNPVKGLIVGD